MCRRLLFVFIICVNFDGACQELNFSTEDFPDGLVISCIESDNVCYYYITTSNNAIYNRSDRVHTCVLIDSMCDLSDLTSLQLRDEYLEQDVVPSILFKHQQFFIEYVSFVYWEDTTIVGEYLIYDDKLRYLKSDTVDYAMVGVYPVSRSDTLLFFGSRNFPPPWKLTLSSFDTRDTSITVRDLDYFGILIAPSAIYDETLGQYLIYHNSGLGILDSSFNLIENIHATFVHTGVLGQLEFYQDKVISFGARLPPSVDRWQVTFNLYERDLTLLEDETYGDTLAEDYPFIKDCLSQTEDAIFTGAMLDIIEPYQTHSKPIEFVVSKYDRDRNLIWRHNYGGDVAYYMWGLKATNDGGCIVYGNRRNDDDGLRYPFIMKLDKDGLTTSAERFPVREAHAFTLYGNPVSTTLRIHGEFAFSKKYAVSLSSMQGQVVLKEDLHNGMNDFDVSTLPSGAYVYTIEDESSGRIVESHIVAIVR